MAQILVSGLTNGCVYALVTLGFVLIYAGSGAVNFAQGELVIIGGFVLAWLTTRFSLPFAVAMPVAVLGVAAFGWVLYRVAFHPLREQPIDAVFVSTIGMTVGLTNLALVLWGPSPQTVQSSFAMHPLHVAGATLSPQVLVVFAVTLLVLVGFYLLMMRTRTGRALRATAEDAETAELVGVPTGRSTALLFVLGTGMAALAGSLFAPFVFLTLNQGNHFILMCFVAAVIGGFGDATGAVVGSLVVGVAQALVGVYITSAYQDAVIFAAIIALLYFRPQGIFGEKVSAKA